MLVQQSFDGGPATCVPAIDEGYRGPLPPTVAATRALLARSLATLGLSGLQIGQVTNMARSTVSDALRTAKEPEPEVEPELPPEAPPVIDPPAPYRRPPVVDVSARFIAGLREEYRKTGDGRTRRIGSLEDVQAWLDSLKPGEVAPRPDA